MKKFNQFLNENLENGELVFKAATKGGKYAIDVYKKKNIHGEYYDKDTDTYDIIKTYPILDRKQSDSVFRSTKLREFKDVDKEDMKDIIEQGKMFKDKLKKGLVKAKLDNGDIVTVLYKNSTGSGEKYIKYEKDGEIIRTFDYEIIDEYIKK